TISYAASRGHLALANVDSVPAGKYAKAALEKLEVWPSVADKLAQSADVRAALLRVSRGQAPVGIVYQTDAQKRAIPTPQPFMRISGGVNEAPGVVFRGRGFGARHSGHLGHVASTGSSTRRHTAGPYIGSATVDQRRSVSRQLYPPIAAAIAAAPLHLPSPSRELAHLPGPGAPLATLHSQS